jgi:hypothetical protein
MKAICCKSKPEEVTFNDHNHSPIGSKEDFQYLSVSEGIKRYIFQKFQEGFMCYVQKKRKKKK